MAADGICARRRWLASVAAWMVAGCGGRGCARAEPGEGAVEQSLVATHEVDFTQAEGGPQKAVVLVPRWGDPQARYPLLIALHGRGESNRGLDVGARGWTRDYYLDRAFGRLRRPPVTLADLSRIGTQGYVADLNKRMAEHPFRGLVVACPYTPDILGTKDLAAAEPFAGFLVEHLIPRMRALYPVEPTAAATGIDGVSLGGRVALLAGFSRISSYGAIGTLQAAVRTAEVEQFADLGARAISGAAKPPPVRLLTSDADPFRPALLALSQAMESRGAKVQYASITGPHDYAFNQGPGSYEMLLWHDRALRGEL